MVMCDIELEKKENKIQTNENTEPRHLLYSGLAFSLVVCLVSVWPWSFKRWITLSTRKITVQCLSIYKSFLKTFVQATVGTVSTS